jgi:hypothetical protein
LSIEPFHRSGWHFGLSLLQFYHLPAADPQDQV